MEGTSARQNHTNPIVQAEPRRVGQCSEMSPEPSAWATALDLLWCYGRVPHVGQPSRFAAWVMSLRELPVTVIVTMSANVPPRGVGVASLSVA